MCHLHCLVKEENALAGKAAKLFVNSWISHFLMKVEFQNFWTLDKAFVAKNVTKTVAKLAKVPLNFKVLFPTL